LQASQLFADLPIAAAVIPAAVDVSVAHLVYFIATVAGLPNIVDILLFPVYSLVPCVGIHFVPLCPHFFTFFSAGVPAAAATRLFYILFQGLFGNYICVKNEIKNIRSPPVRPKVVFVRK
jgi:hypothetical protein